MIKNMSSIQNPIMNFISKMMDHDSFTFYLTGSRYFGNAQPQSDWDFFCQYSSEVTDWLRENGFQEHYTDPGYKDSELVCLMRNNAVKMDIQLVKDAELKWKVQQLLMTRADFRRMLLTMGKQYHSALWDMMYCFVKDIPTGIYRPDQSTQDMHRDQLMLPDISRIIPI